MILTKIYILSLALLFIVNDLVTGQNITPEHFKNEYSFTCENDFFLLSGSDRYYTNGLFFERRSLPKKYSILKKINKIQLGQEIFNAYKRKIEPGDIGEIDRPVAAFLFFKYQQIKFINKSSQFTWSITPGIVGPAALGKELQSSWHRIIGIRSKWDWIWDYQIKNEAGIDLDAGYAKNLIQTRNSWFQITPDSKVTLGTLHTAGSAAVLFQFGKINLINESDYWSTKLSSDIHNPNEAIELFAFYRAQVLYQVYNSTVQGGLFRLDKGPIISRLSTNTFSNEIGVHASNLRYGFTFKLIYEGKEAASQFNNHIYGSVSLIGRFY